MSLAVVHSRALDGLAAPAVTVEVHLANGLPAFTLVGLADTEVKEARERVRAALLSVGLAFPHNRRITVSLAPADLPKESGRFDLPIALGILAASGIVDARRLAGFEFAGELSLGGDLRPVRGALAMALALRRDAQPVERALVLPAESAAQAALARGTRVHAANHLLEVVRSLLPVSGETPAVELPLAAPPAQAAAPAHPDLRDVKGQAGAKRALEIAAAGGHSLLMIGPPGTGKSMLAQRLVGLLPALAHEEALESAALLSLAGRFAPEQWGRRVLRAPHHSASPVALVGGGSPPRPGEISLAHHGVLFLDELVEYPRAALEALREPLETGHITISRAARRADFPARFQLVAAMNPCPCGHWGNPLQVCRCTPDAVARYQGKLSGPLLDRIDLRVEVTAVAPETLSASPDGEPTGVIAQRVAAARARAQARQGGVNARLAGDALDRCVALDAATAQFLHVAAARLGWSARGHHRVLRLARTIADLAGRASITTADLAEAMQYRRLPSGQQPAGVPRR
jgi:magnesium chelatase family protein